MRCVRVGLAHRASGLGQSIISAGLGAHVTGKIAVDSHTLVSACFVAAFTSAACLAVAAAVLFVGSGAGLFGRIVACVRRRAYTLLSDLLKTGLTAMAPILTTITRFHVGLFAFGLQSCAAFVRIRVSHTLVSTRFETAFASAACLAIAAAVLFVGSRADSLSRIIARVRRFACGSSCGSGAHGSILRPRRTPFRANATIVAVTSVLFDDVSFPTD